MVVIGSVESRECLCVPGFTPGRDSIENLIKELSEGDWKRDEIVVPIKNHGHVKFIPGFHSNEITDYCVWSRHNYATSTVRAARRIGVMDTDGVKLIAEGLLRMEDRSPGMLSPKNLKKIKAMT